MCDEENEGVDEGRSIPLPHDIDGTNDSHGME